MAVLDDDRVNRMNRIEAHRDGYYMCYIPYTTRCLNAGMMTDTGRKSPTRRQTHLSSSSS
jgi:hypothetical protein